MHPETHLDIVRQRHRDLLREARAGKLAKRVELARDEERRSFLSRLRREPKPGRRSALQTSS
jgi:hypothetical protein